MIYKYRITLKQQLMLLWQPIVVYISVIIIWIYFLNYPFCNDALYVMCGFLFFFDTVPALILHIQYLIKNRRTLLFIDEANRTITYENPKKKAENIQFSDINCLEYYVSNVRNTGIYSFCRYRYCKIILKNGEEFVITCLMVNDIKNTLELLLHLKSEEKLKIMCFI